MIYVMSDIHGNLERFNSVMRQINLQPEDTLYILGDVVDRFPDGIRILRKLMAMPNVKMLIGNHEYMMLNTLDTNIEKSEMGPVQRMQYEYNEAIWYRNGGRVTHDYLKHIKKSLRREIFDFLQSLPLFYDVEINDKKYKLVHAAPPDWFDDLWVARKYSSRREFSVWYRLRKHEEINGDYILIFGHTPTQHYSDADPLEVWFGDNRICIDCGAGYSSCPDFNSRLACLRLDDLKAFYSET